ncbi:MAG: MFS transporter [Bacteroidota bacterium]
MGTDFVPAIIYAILFSILLKTNRMLRWQMTTAVSLFAGYSGYYICRSNLSIVTPLLIEEFASQGMNKAVIGQIASLGLVCYSVGKAINGVMGDLVGGKKIFILGMLGSVVATLLFGLSWRVAVFWVAWAANRMIQSMGWGGLVKTTVNWFSYKSYGKVMGWLSLSYLFGDILAKLVLGQLLHFHIGWRAIFFIAALILAVIALVQIAVLKDNPESLGLEAPELNPNNLFKDVNPVAPAPSESIGALLRPYLRSFSFLLMLLMSFGFTAVREAFNFWMPTYLYEASQVGQGEAAQLSALFPLFGMISILGAGYLSDTLFKGQRGLILLLSALALTGVLFLMGFGIAGKMLSLVLISLVGLFLLGPYSFLAGAMSLDAGGRKGSATAAGLVDSVGYMGGTLALWSTGLLAERSGWNHAFLALAGMAAFTALAAFLFYVTQERKIHLSTSTELS